MGLAAYADRLQLHQLILLLSVLSPYNWSALGQTGAGVSLKCYCDEEYCINDNFTCSVDNPGYPDSLGHYNGGCIAYHNTVGKPPYRQKHGCFAGQSPFSCKNATFSVSRCCSVKDGDFCNEDQHLSRPSLIPTTPPVTTIVHIHQYKYVEIAVPFAIVVVLCLAVIIIFIALRKRRPRESASGAKAKTRSAAAASDGSTPYTRGDGDDSEDSMSSSEYLVSRMLSRPKGFVPKATPGGAGGGDSMSMTSNWTSGSYIALN